MNATLFSILASTKIIVVGRTQDLHLDKIKSNSYVPLGPRLIAPQPAGVLACLARIQPLLVFGIMYWETVWILVRTPILGPQHQHGRRNPQQKYQSFRCQSYYRSCCRTSGEGIAVHVVRNEVV